METSVILSGFGGQGALLAGQMLAYAAMDAGLEVTWIPSYGSEVRAGAAHCTVVIGDEPIGSPIVQSPDFVIAMNLPSADDYEPKVRNGGLLIWDSTLVTRPPRRTDVTLLSMPANDIATGVGDGRLVNMVMLGALCIASGIVSAEQMAHTLRLHLPDRNRGELELHLAALREGAKWFRERGA
jgi:2-oxoglutarate ferredoxin oxidoreductase subunit gamma